MWPELVKVWADLQATFCSIPEEYRIWGGVSVVIVILLLAVVWYRTSEQVWYEGFNKSRDEHLETTKMLNERTRELSLARASLKRLNEEADAAKAKTVQVDWSVPAGTDTTPILQALGDLSTNLVNVIQTVVDKAFNTVQDMHKTSHETLQAVVSDLSATEDEDEDEDYDNN